MARWSSCGGVAMVFPLGRLDPVRKEGRGMVMVFLRVHRGYFGAPLCFAGDGQRPWWLGGGRSSVTGQHRGGERASSGGEGRGGRCGARWLPQWHHGGLLEESSWLGSNGGHGCRFGVK